MDSRNSDSRRSSSSSGTSGVKSKWIKAFRSLKLTTVGSSSRNEVGSRENQNAMRISAHLGVHAFQEYTYKKITACDVCREILRGHARQGLKCKLCKMNVHSGCCQENAPKCQPKPRLLRKQKSASELETKIAIPQIEDERANYDPMYQSLRAAADARRCAQYVSDGYMASHEYAADNSNGSLSSGGGAGVVVKNNNNGGGNYHHHLNQRADSNEGGGGSSNNVSMAASSSNINNGHGGGGGHLGSSGALANHGDPMVMSSAVQHRNSCSTADEQQQQQQFHQQQCYQQQQQQQPPPLLRYNNHINNSYNGSGNGGNGNGNHELQRIQHIKSQQQQQQLQHPNSPALLSIAQTSHQAYSAPHSPQKKRLTLRMKSLSLDSPESVETLAGKGGDNGSSGGNNIICGPGGKVGPRMGSGGTCPLPNNTFAPGFYPAVGGSSSSSVHTPPYEPEGAVMGGVNGGGNYKYKGAPPTASPAMPKRFKLGMHGRMCSIENDPTMVDLSSSLSPCPSPKPQRLLPTNIFVVLYNFRSRQLDELNLRAGYMVTVVDTTDPEWWQGKCLGQVGYFPSKYVTKLFPGERPLQVIHTVQVNDGEFATKLIREQIVIQVSDEVSGMIMVRTGTGINDKIVPCPSKYLQEINL